MTDDQKAYLRECVDKALCAMDDYDGDLFVAGTGLLTDLRHLLGPGLYARCDGNAQVRYAAERAFKHLTDEPAEDGPSVIGEDLTLD